MIEKKQFILSGSGNKTIAGDLTYDNSKTNLPTIIFVHGFKGFKDWGAHHLTAAYFAEHGYRYLKFNLSHSGVSADKPNDVTDMDAFAANTFSYELKDIETIINYAAHTFPQDPIYMIGHSRGGGLAIIKAADDERIQKIVTWSAIADFSSLWKKEQEEQWLSEGQIFVENARTKEKMPLNSTLLSDFNTHKHEYNIINAASRISIPWLILHGDDDVNVNFSTAQHLAQAQPKAKLQKIAGANHVFGASHPYTPAELPAQLQEVCEKTLDFLNS